MICSSVKRLRFMLWSSYGPERTSIWIKSRGQGHIRNIFAHEQRAQDFGFGRCRDLANNLCVSEKLEFYRPNLASPTSVSELKAGDEVWLAIGLREAFGSREEGPTSVLPELSPGQGLSPREKYLRSCNFYIAYLFMTLCKNLGERFGSGFIFS
ncbi:hypothetical protein IVB12_07480, partial [Bradyrhizobium sp. 179]|uniref:hypothetical protein n=1 Tax=Bradyrhizobium sp. 179 TaxID=2782648 RepID=UPI001FFB71C4